MQELSLNILDITQNSIKAGADRVDITVVESVSKNLIKITIADNGRGMEAEFLQKVLDPFVTTRSTRKVGLGLPLFKQQAVAAGGDLDIQSEPGNGTTVEASFELDNIDRVPLGDIASTITTLIGSDTGVRFVYRHITDKGEFCLDTDEVRNELGEVSISQPEILIWLEQYIKENLDEIEGGIH